MTDMAAALFGGIIGWLVLRGQSAIGLLAVP